MEHQNDLALYNKPNNSYKGDLGLKLKKKKEFQIALGMDQVAIKFC